MNKGWPKGVKRGPMSAAGRVTRSVAQKGRIISWGHKISDAKKGTATSIRKGDKRSDEDRSKIKNGFTDASREKISRTHLGRQLSDAHKATISAFMKTEGRRNFTGGKIADSFAEILCPVGFIREYKFYYAKGIHSYFQFDFAHVEGQVCIEIDGPAHRKTKSYDAQRDEIVKYFGWRVIRIKNY
jgi:hypothetical protein